MANVAETADAADAADVAEAEETAEGPDGAERQAAWTAARPRTPGRPHTADSPDGEIPSLAYLTFAACAAYAGDDAAGARRLMDEALASAAGDPAMRVRLTGHLDVCGRAVDSVELLEARLRESPEDDYAAERYAVAIEHIFAHASGEPPAGPCRCGTGLSWRDCCAPKERAALDRFADRSGLCALPDAVAKYLPKSGYARAVPAYVANWMSMSDTGGWDEQETLRGLITELAWTTARTSGADARGAPGTDDDGASGSASADPDNLLTAFAADPATPLALAARARAWLDHVHHGLWQISTVAPSPGRWCIDIATGVARYVAFGPELAGNLPRWTVVLGAVVPLDGVWRLTGPALRLSPMKADAATETVHAGAGLIVRQLSGKPTKHLASRMRQPVPFGGAEPHGVLVHLHEEDGPETTRLVSMVTASSLARIAAELHNWRTGSPAVFDTASIDPGQDVAWPSRPRTLTGKAAGQDEGWERQWLDERVLALRGRTPRQAAQSKERVLLEGLLRQFEYEADLLAHEGESGADTAWLRCELGMSAEEFD